MEDYNLSYKRKVSCEPADWEVYYEAITGPDILGQPRRPENVVRAELTESKKRSRFYSLRDSRGKDFVQYILNPALNEAGFPSVDTKDWDDIDKCPYSTSPFSAFPSINMGSGYKHLSAVYASVVKNGIISISYYANNDTWNRRHKSFNCHVFVSHEGEMLCADKDAELIKSAGFDLK